MMNRVAGKVALVTGASSGLGTAIARMLAREGAAVVLSDIDDAAGEALAQDILAAGGKAAYTNLNVSSEEQWVATMRHIQERFGGLHVTVNNAGIGIPRTFPTETTLEDWRRLMSVNMEGVFLGTKHSIATMRETRPVNGSIINVSSVAGLAGIADLGPYCASKGGVRLYTKSAALSCAERGLKIRVNSVHPGFIDTPLLQRGKRRIASREEADRIYNAIQPIGHLGEPEDIAYGVLFLASDESKFVIGSELVIDGGYTTC